MAHFAQIENDLVVSVLVADAEYISTQSGTWVQTSYNTHGGKHYDAETGLLSTDQSKALRKNYAGVGYTYDSVRDAFIPPKPFDSWVLVEETCLWEAPIEMPDLTPEQEAAGNYYAWDEPSLSWKLYPE